MEMQLTPRIVANPDVLSGEPIVAGTTISVSAVLRDLACGQHAADVATRRGLTEEDVQAALEYAAQVVHWPIPWDDPLVRLAGVFEGDTSDWGDRHDEYIAEEAAATHADDE